MLYEVITDISAHPDIHCGYEVSAKGRNIFGTFPERRQMKPNHIEPVEEVLTKTAVFNFFLNGPVRGGNYSDIKFNLAYRTKSLYT